MILRNVFAFLLTLMLTSSLPAEERFVAASTSDPVVGRYLVLFAGDDRANDETAADAIARAYGARIEPYADSSIRGAMLHMRPAQARLLSEDVRVLRVEEQPLSGDAVPQGPQPAAAAPARRAAVADASFSPVTTAETPIWSSGTYEYDDTGNIKKIGDDSYRYDGVGRLVYATALTPGNVNNIQSYGYDEFGNMTLRVTDPHGTFPIAETYAVNAATNQLTSAQYDDTGNQISIEPNGGVLAYDAAGMLMTLMAGSNKLAYVYDANDERVVTVELVNGNESRHRYTLRGSDNKIARELTLEPLTMNWHLVKDYVHRGGALMASFSSPTATAADRHYHLDHLGSTRLITDASGTAVATMTYYPFGLEAPGSTPTPGDRLKFTGHERDTDGAAAAFNLDYMHARYYNGALGRFLRMDPVLNLKAAVTNPQMWNRYAYVSNNPINKVDPTGAYEWDVHFGLTLQLARAAGFTDDQAFKIADANQHVDIDPNTQPFSNPSARAGYHFTTEGRRDLFWRVFESTAASEGHMGALTGLGTFLHAQQDSFSHDGFGPGIGHLLAGHAPDKTHSDPAKAFQMATDTFRRLNAAADSMGISKGNRTAWKTIRASVLAFNLARTQEAKLEALRQMHMAIDEARDE